jgi:16S rRNA (cytosine1402-N4)-methyltransferase
VKGNFRDIANIVSEAGIGPVAGVLMDLGVSSHQVDAAERGFSFNSGTLDMRMDASQPVSAADLVATLPERDLAQLLFDLGEERLARRFAQAIVQARQTGPITSGQRLADIIRAASPVSYRHGPIHPATRTFQALRLAVNDELGSLALALPQAASVLAARGRLAVISFHSLEDRLVKRFIQQDDSVSAITKQPIMATDVEIASNPRSRSAKLRIAEKIAHE